MKEEINRKFITYSDKILVFPFLKSLKEYSISFNVSTLIFNGELRIERPGRDSNPGRRSDSPTYWTGIYDAKFNNSYTASLYYPGALNLFYKSN